MSSKFRQDSFRRNYTVRTFLKRCLAFGLISMIMVFCTSSLVAFYLFIEYEVEQSILISYMQNLKIRTKTLAMIKTNEIESVGLDLSTMAQILSDLVTDTDNFAEQDYLNAYASFLSEGVVLGQCKTSEKTCESQDGLRQYNIDFYGKIEQNGVDQFSWKGDMLESYQADRGYLLEKCDFGCEINGRKLSP